jgi:hypothetical protein
MSIGVARKVPCRRAVFLSPRFNHEFSKLQELSKKFEKVASDRYGGKQPIKADARHVD